jgi:hypothetical protein
MKGSTRALLEPLPAPLRADLESRFNVGFGDVHLRREATGRAAHGDFTRASAVGTEIALAAGEPDQWSADGRWLLAHELAHLIQQSRGRAGHDHGTPEALERSADDAADAVAAGSREVIVKGAAAAGVPQEKKGRKKPEAEIGDALPYSQQGKAIWIGGTRGSEHEHIRARVNLRLITTSPTGQASPYDRAAYRRSVTLTIPRDMAKIKTRKDLALRDRIKAGTASVDDVQIATDIRHTIEARDDAIAARRQAGRPTADLESLTDDKIAAAAHGQQHELFGVGRRQVKPWAGMTDAEFRAESGMSDDVFERTAGTGIEEHAGPTTTVEIADPRQPRALTPIEAAAEQAAFDKSPAVQAYRARKAAEVAAKAQAPVTSDAAPLAATAAPTSPAPVEADLAPAPVVAAPTLQPSATLEAEGSVPETAPAAAKTAVPPIPTEAAEPPASQAAVSSEPHAAPVPVKPVVTTTTPADLPEIGSVPANVAAPVPVKPVAATSAVSESVAAPTSSAPVKSAAPFEPATRVRPTGSQSGYVGKASKVNAALGAVREVRARHNELVARGVSPTLAWVQAAGRAGATLAANLRGGRTAAAVNTFNAYEQARHEGQDQLEAGATAVGTLGGALATKAGPAAVTVELANHVANLAGAPEGVQVATSGAVEALPSTAAVRVVSAGARSLAALGKGVYRSVKTGSIDRGLQEVDKVADSFARGDAGPMIQGAALWTRIAADVASGDSFAKARDSAAAFGERDSQGNQTWSSRTAEKLAHVYLNLTHDPVERYDPVKEKQGKWERRLRRAFSW